MKGIFANRSRTFLVLAVLGLALRFGFVFAASDNQITFHSGGSDAPLYVLLAQNLLNQDGFTYAHQPTAFRPPGYPVLLAGFMAMFGRRYIFAVRMLQLLLGIFTVVICSSATLRLSGRRAAEAAFVFGLFLPTLIFSTAQMLTECLAAFLTALYLRYMVIQVEQSDTGSAWGMGLTTGAEALVRYNAAALAPLAAWTVLRSRGQKARISRIAIVLLVPLLVVTPWLIRNEIAFHGRVLFSTQSGTAAVMGVVMPQGRSNPDDIEKMRAAMPWWTEPLETNSPARLALPSEAEINRRALRAVPGLWAQEGWHAIPLLATKLAAFWLSTDQVIDTEALPMRERLIRDGGVLAYWVVLVFAVCGWFALRGTHPRMASLLLVYAVGYTVLHLPLVMNTRLRIPLMDPLVVILSGSGWAWFVERMGWTREVPGAGSRVEV